jgi:hypothetical protein
MSNDNDLIRRGDALALLLGMRGPVDVPRTEKAVWVDEGIDRCIQELHDIPTAANGIDALPAVTAPQGVDALAAELVSEERIKYEKLCARVSAGKASQQEAVDAIMQLCRDNERLAVLVGKARAALARIKGAAK